MVTAVEVTSQMLEHYPDHERLVGNMKYFNSLVQKGEAEPVEDSDSKFKCFKFWI